MGQHTIAFFSSRFSERKITRRSPQYHHRSVAAPSPTPTNVLLLPATSSPCHAVSPNSSPASVALQHGRPPASVALKHGRPHPQSADRPLHCSSAAHQRVALQLRRPARSATPHCTAAPPPAGSSMPVALQLPRPRPAHRRVALQLRRPPRAARTRHTRCMEASPAADEIHGLQRSSSATLVTLHRRARQDQPQPTMPTMRPLPPLQRRPRLCRRRAVRLQCRQHQPPFNTGLQQPTLCCGRRLQHPRRDSPVVVLVSTAASGAPGAL